MTTHSATPPALSVTDLSVRFITRHGDVPALTAATLAVPAGEFLIVVGESGSGKSVLAQAVLRALPANAHTQGRVAVAGQDVTGLRADQLRRLRRHHVAYIPQSPATALNPVRRLGGLLTELARARGLSRAAARTALRTALAELDLDFDALARQYPHQLSGGMQQRVLNALATVGSPELVIADEPTAGLDPDLVAATAAGLRRLTRRGAGVLVVTHDLRLAQQLGGHIALVYGSYVMEHRPTADFFAGPAHPYGEGLLAALPERGGRPVPGHPVELTALPAGCAFAPRCPVRVAECDDATPVPRDIPGTTGDGDTAGRGVVRCYRPRERIHSAAG